MTKKTNNAKKTKKTKHYRPPGKKIEGNARRYFTRSQAIRQLQVSLPLFRRLCILKGISPREPKKKVRGNDKTYYHAKDIAFLQHEPLLEKYRDLAAYEKKIKKAEAKKNDERAHLLRIHQPPIRLDALILERYPRFIDALRDLDDCLTMVHLFAVLPAVERFKIDAERVHNCRRLSHEWQAYIARTHKLRKVFVSVKGIYYQAEIEGQNITWLTPHSTQQVLPEDVNYSIMLIFLEFYETLLGFVNFRLYHTINVKYPPILDPRLEELAADLYALVRYIDANSKASMLESIASSSSTGEQVDVQHESQEAEDESKLRLAQLQHQLPSNEPSTLMHLLEDAENEKEEDKDTKECKELFKNVKFFLSREVPRESLLFVIPAFGGTVSWDGDGAPFKEDDQTITHQIVDRPTQGHRYLSREYVQPQWIYDCVNARIILPTDGYLLGRIPPPHLSPFVDNEAEGYIPEYAETIKRLQAAARNDVLPMPGSGMDDLDDPQNLLLEGYINRKEANEAAERERKKEADQKQYLEELKMEVEKYKPSSTSKKIKQVSDDADAMEESGLDLEKQKTEDIENMSTLILPRKKRGLLRAMQISKERKQERVNRLKERRKQLDSQASGN